jgi:1-aminocyclopropane-1-carboxylate deaminase/D-cysteine desulfhydrase-like pyridoxal-dependent ACC family enzyme
MKLLATLVTFGLLVVGVSYMGTAVESLAIGAAASGQMLDKNIEELNKAKAELASVKAERDSVKAEREHILEVTAWYDKTVERVDSAKAKVTGFFSSNK